MRHRLLGIGFATLALFFSPERATAETRSFVCYVSEAQLQVVRMDERDESRQSNFVADVISARVPGCGGLVNPGDRVIVRFVLESPVIAASTTRSWSVGGGLWADGGGGFGPIFYTSHSMTIEGTNVRTSPASGGAADVTSGTAGWPLNSFYLGAWRADAVVDPTMDAWINAITITVDIPTTTLWGGEPQVLASGQLNNGHFYLSGMTYERDPSVLIGPMIAVGSPFARVEILKANTVGVLQVEGVNAATIAALTAKLDAASAQLSGGQPGAAAGQLRAYVNQINALVNAGSISEDAAEKLTTPAMDLIKRIRPR